MSEAGMSNDAFSTIMSALDSPLVVVTAAVDDERAGCLVGFHAQSSIDPERYCVWLSKANHTYRVALRSTHLGIHFLTVHQLTLAELFGTQTGDTVDKFERLSVDTDPWGVPLLADCPNRIVVQRIALLDEGGDHVCISGESISVEAAGAFTPLRLSQAAHLTPGHENDERNSPPTERSSL
jgi:flavin reductase (DIM6/NTAB) family NADH-FMN oxidoreductase RutF